MKNSFGKSGLVRNNHWGALEVKLPVKAPRVEGRAGCEAGAALELNLTYNILGFI